MGELDQARGHAGGQPPERAPSVLSITPVFGVALGLGLGLLACGQNADRNPPVGEDNPYRDEWRAAFSVPFPYDATAPEPGIESIRIGEPVAKVGVEQRGDILVVFDAPPATISVDLRRTTFAGSAAQAEDQFEQIQVVALDAAGHDCTERWWDRCTLSVSYDGQSQPLRDGADLRVHLPADYHHALEIFAHDNAVDQGYPDRANVCLDGFAGVAEVTMGSGIAVVKMSEAAHPAPLCPPDQQAECEQSEWGPACACSPGELTIVNRDFHSSNMSVDVPPGLWAEVDLTNVDTQGPACDLRFDVPGAELGIDTQVQKSGEVDRPAGATDLARGYQIEMRSDQCVDAPWVDGPDDFGAPNIERRGDLRVCSGCLGASSCEELLGGL